MAQLMSSRSPVHSKRRKYEFPRLLTHPGRSVWLEGVSCTTFSKFDINFSTSPVSPRRSKCLASNHTRLLSRPAFSGCPSGVSFTTSSKFEIAFLMFPISPRRSKRFKKKNIPQLLKSPAFFSFSKCHIVPLVGRFFTFIKCRPLFCPTEWISVFVQILSLLLPPSHDHRLKFIRM